MEESIQALETDIEFENLQKTASKVFKKMDELRSQYEACYGKLDMEDNDE